MERKFNRNVKTYHLVVIKPHELSFDRTVLQNLGVAPPPKAMSMLPHPGLPPRVPSGR